MKPTEETEIADKKFNRRRAVGAGLWTSCATGLVLGVGFLAFAVSGLIIIGYLLLGGAAPDDAFSFMVVPVVTAIAIICVVWIVGLSRFKFSRSTAVGAVVGLTLTVVGGVTLITTDWDIREEVNQVNGQVHMATTIFHPRNGWRQWLPNGRRKEAEYYTVDGWPEGPQTLWYENGQKFMEENYVEGRLGHPVSTTFWYENGQKEREEVYVNGETTRTEWHRNGVKRMESRTRYSEQLHPIETWWDQDGNVCDRRYDSNLERCD